MKKTIPAEEIEYRPFTGQDRTGRLFFWNDRLFRGIYSDYDSFYRNIFNGGMDDLLKQNKFIDTKITPYKLEIFPLVLEHRIIPIQSFAAEWCSAMLKEAALLTCDLEISLLRRGYALKDAHPWNILFESCNPFFIDAGSISEPTQQYITRFLKQFRATFLLPLLLKYGAYDDIASAMLLANTKISDISIFRMLIGRGPLLDIICHRHRVHRIGRIWEKSPLKGVELLREEVESIPVETIKLARPEDDGHLNYNRPKEILELLDSLSPETVLDTWAENRWYEHFIDDRKVQIIAVHQNNIALNTIFQRAKKENLTILPLQLDISRPTLSHGIWGRFPAAKDRLRADLVIMSNLMELLDRQTWCKNNMGYYLSTFAKKWLLIDLELEYLEKLREAKREKISMWLDHELMKQLGNHFDVSRTISETNGRRFIFCEKSG